MKDGGSLGVAVMAEAMDPQNFEMLDEPLDPDNIATRKAGGGKVPYIEGHYAFSTANRIFGADNWGYTTTEPKMTVLEGGPVWMCMVTVYVRGCVPVTEVGIALPYIKRGTADPTRESHRTAILGAVTQGVKRCLRTFGPAFGLELYDEDYRDEFFESQRQSRQGGRQAQRSQGANPVARPRDPVTLRDGLRERINAICKADTTWEEPAPDPLSNIVSSTLMPIFAEYEGDNTPFSPIDCIDMVCEYLVGKSFAETPKGMMVGLRTWLVGDKPAKNGQWEVDEDTVTEVKAVLQFAINTMS